MVDAYGYEAIVCYAARIRNDLSEFGDSIYNGIYNIEMNALPFPKVRKLNKPENKSRRRK